jgi:hypothetical protein
MQLIRCRLCPYAFYTVDEANQHMLDVHPAFIPKPLAVAVHEAIYCQRSL